MISKSDAFGKKTIKEVFNLSDEELQKIQHFQNNELTNQFTKNDYKEILDILTDKVNSMQKISDDDKADYLAGIYKQETESLRIQAYKEIANEKKAMISEIQLELDKDKKDKLNALSEETENKRQIELEKLNREKQNIEIEIDRENKKLTSLNDKIKDITNELNNLQTEKQTILNDITEVEAERKKSINILAELEENIEQQKTKFNNLQTQTNALQTNFNNLQTKFNNLQTETNNLQAVSNNLQNIKQILTKDVNVLETNKQEITKEITTLETVKINVTKSLENMKLECSELEETNDVLEETNKKLNRDLEIIRNNIDINNDLLTNLNERVDNKQNELNTLNEKIANNTIELDNLNEDIQRNEDIKNNLNAVIISLKEERDKTDRELWEIANDLTALNRVSKYFSSVEENLNKTLSECTASLNDSVKNKIEEHKSNIQTILVDKTEAIENSIKEVDMSSSLNTINSKISSSIEELDISSDSLRKVSDKISSESSNISALSNQLSKSIELMDVSVSKQRHYTSEFREYNYNRLTIGTFNKLNKTTIKSLCKNVTPVIKGYLGGLLPDSTINNVIEKYPSNPQIILSELQDLTGYDDALIPAFCAIGQVLFRSIITQDSLKHMRLIVFRRVDYPIVKEVVTKIEVALAKNGRMPRMMTDDGVYCDKVMDNVDVYAMDRELSNNEREAAKQLDVKEDRVEIYNAILETFYLACEKNDSDARNKIMLLKHSVLQDPYYLAKLRYSLDMDNTLTETTFTVPVWTDVTSIKYREITGSSYLEACRNYYAKANTTNDTDNGYEVKIGETVFLVGYDELLKSKRQQ